MPIHSTGIAGRRRRLLSAVCASLIACSIADDAAAQSSVSLYGLADVYAGTQRVSASRARMR